MAEKAENVEEASLVLTGFNAKARKLERSQKRRDAKAAGGEICGFRSECSIASSARSAADAAAADEAASASAAAAAAARPAAKFYIGTSVNCTACSLSGMSNPP